MAHEPSISEIQAALSTSNASWKAERTSLSELSADQKQLRLGYVPGPGEPSLVQREQAAKAHLLEKGVQAEGYGAPPSFDLRNVGGRNFITAVKDQGGCGSCVAFGAVATVEGTLRMVRNDPNLNTNLSEAHLFYCHARAQGRNCGNGWWAPPALDAFRDIGVVDEGCYPYTAGDQNCSNLCADWRSRVTRVRSWSSLRSTADMKTWLSSKGPLVACFTVYNDFFSYRSGVYRHVTGALAGGHCVSVVGYDDPGGYWICKNSWGTGWGEAGFFRIAYGQCGIDAEMWGVDAGQVSRTVPLYRYWNGGAGDHFYTTNWNELRAGASGWVYEGVQCHIYPSQFPNTVPLYRYWNGGAGDHFYTTNWNELRGGAYGWSYEGIQGFVHPTQVAGTVPLYRYWNGGIADHFYTTNWNELRGGAYGWSYEGIQCYVFPQPVNLSGPGVQNGSDQPPTTPVLPAAGPSDPQSSEVPAGSMAAVPCGCAGKEPPASFSTRGAGSPATPVPSTFQVEPEATPGPAASPPSFTVAGAEDGKPGDSFRMIESHGEGTVTVTVTFKR